MSKSNILDKIIRREERNDEFYAYSYELIMREGNATACFRMPLYSIRINMTDPTGYEKSADARDIFADKQKAFDFFDRIVDNLATPIDLAYIVEDELSD